MAFSILRFGGALAAFILLATLNSAGYRYGASDQAYYIPAVRLHLDPSLFPRDAVLIVSQSRLTLMDDVVAELVRVTGASLPHLFFALYLLTLALLFVAVVRIAGRMYRTTWAAVALGAAFTLRHAIAKTGANTLEGYFHPRELAFAMGLLAVAMLLERREAIAAALLVSAGLLHPTTAMWFAVWIGVAAWVARPRWRLPLAGLAVAGALAIGWMIWRGPFAGHLTRMDAPWLAVLASKDYLFPLEWPINAWLTNLVTIPVIVIAWHVRRRAGLTVPGETALVCGALALAILFVCWLPFNAARVALAVQLQTSRLFWMLDALATVYLVWALAEGRQVRARRAAAVAVALIAFSSGRALYTSFIEFPTRPMFSVDLQDNDWRTAMQWARATPDSRGWLADPGHASRYGSSLRAAGERDVLLEEAKDTAMAMYDRNVAMRVADRQRALASLAWDTPDGARALARRYDLGYLVIDRPLDLPLAARAGALYIYRLR